MTVTVIDFADWSIDRLVENPSSAQRFDLRKPHSLFVPSRIDLPELLDMGAGTAQDVEANFADLRRINQYLGGLRALTLHLFPRLRAHEGVATLVDIGTGSGDIPILITQWAERQQIPLKIWGFDLSARNLAVARQNGTKKSDSLLQADALQMPFRKGIVDYFISSLFLHHLPPGQVKIFLAQTFESASKGIIMSDLTRGWLPLIAFKLSQPMFAHNFLTRYDGLASIRRAYTPSEVYELARAAGLSNIHVYQHWAWRMTLVADK